MNHSVGKGYVDWFKPIMAHSWCWSYGGSHPNHITKNRDREIVFRGNLADWYQGGRE